MFKIDQEKLAKVTEIINDEVQPDATESDVSAFVLADWEEGQEHQDWLDDAAAEEIADWVIAGVWS